MAFGMACPPGKLLPQPEMTCNIMHGLITPHHTSAKDTTRYTQATATHSRKKLQHFAHECPHKIHTSHSNSQQPKKHTSHSKSQQVLAPAFGHGDAAHECPHKIHTSHSNTQQEKAPAFGHGDEHPQTWPRAHLWPLATRKRLGATDASLEVLVLLNKGFPMAPHMPYQEV
jgi:hypothetical protein